MIYGKKRYVNGTNTVVYGRKRFVYGRIQSVSGDRIQSPGSYPPATHRFHEEEIVNGLVFVVLLAKDELESQLEMTR
jgi:hypothetical protein